MQVYFKMNNITQATQMARTVRNIFGEDFEVGARAWG